MQLSNLVLVMNYVKLKLLIHYIMQNKCPICGRVDDPEEYISSRIKEIMEEKKCCFHCAFWYRIHYMDPDEETIPVVVNHTHWSFPSKEPVHYQKSHGWSYRPIPTMNYILFDDGRVAETNQLWHQGNIPEPFRELLPNNAVFIDKADFDQICCHVSNNSSTKAITCPQPLLNFLLKKYEFSK